jgi:hypothetical protein
MKLSTPRWSHYQWTKPNSAKPPPKPCARKTCYTSAWRATGIEDVATREKLFLAINIVGKVRDHLASIVAGGKLAQAELNELARTAERRKRFGIV